MDLYGFKAGNPQILKILIGTRLTLCSEMPALVTTHEEVGSPTNR